MISTRNDYGNLLFYNRAVADGETSRNKTRPYMQLTFRDLLLPSHPKQPFAIFILLRCNINEC